MQMIEPTDSAPYALRFITDDHAVEYRYSLADSLFRARVKRRTPQGETLLEERTTPFRTLAEIRAAGDTHAQTLIAAL